MYTTHLTVTQDFQSDTVTREILCGILSNDSIIIYSRARNGPKETITVQ